MNIVSIFSTLWKTYNVDKYVPFMNFAFLPFIRENPFICKIIILKSLFDIYNHREYYKKDMLILFNTLILLKIKFDSRMRNASSHRPLPGKEDFRLTRLLLFTSLSEYTDITEYFHELGPVHFIDADFIKMAYLGREMHEDENIRLKIFFTYKESEYILYFPYKKPTPHKLHCIPYPPYSEKIMSYYRNDIVIPTYMKHRHKKHFYTTFQMDSKDIMEVKINDTCDPEMERYFDMIQTPFCDFGKLYHCPVKLEWALVENGIDMEIFRSLTLKYVNPHLNEDTMELEDHVIQFTSRDMKEEILSPMMKKVIDLM